jgi:hypothetical protein
MNKIQFIQIINLFQKKMIIFLQKTIRQHFFIIHTNSKKKY